MHIYTQKNVGNRTHPHFKSDQFWVVRLEGFELSSLYFCTFLFMTIMYYLYNHKKNEAAHISSFSEQKTKNMVGGDYVVFRHSSKRKLNQKGDS